MGYAVVGSTGASPKARGGCISGSNPTVGELSTKRFPNRQLGAGHVDLPSHNLAARMARWSSKHRKKAFWGWLAFVILAFAIGNAVGPNNISDVDNFNGESHEAEAALDRAGLRPSRRSCSSRATSSPSRTRSSGPRSRT